MKNQRDEPKSAFHTDLCWAADPPVSILSNAEEQS